MHKSKISQVTTIDMSLRYLLFNQICNLQQEGYDVVAISSAGENVPTLNAAGIRHIAVPMTRNFTPFADMVSLWRLIKVLRQEKFIVVHTHTPKPGLLGQIAARIAGVPVVVNTIHGYYFHENMSAFWRKFYILIEKFSAQFSSLIFFVNAEDMQTAVQEKISPLRKMRRLSPGGIGINIKRFDRQKIPVERLVAKRSELGLMQGTPIVGFVGRLVAEKGVLELMQAAYLVRQEIPDVRFLFIGPIDDEKVDSVKPETAVAYNVADICLFTGLRQDIPDLLALMDVFVLPSHREGFPVSPMEASAMGVPSVVTDVRGCREVVENGRNGLIVPLGDVKALAKAIIELLTDKEKAHQMGAIGRQMAQERFDEQIVFAHVKAEYKRLLQEKGITFENTQRSSNLMSL